MSLPPTCEFLEHWWLMICLQGKDPQMQSGCCDLSCCDAIDTRATWVLAMNLGLSMLQWSYYSWEYARLLLMQVSLKLNLVIRFKVSGLRENSAVILARLCCLSYVWSTNAFSLLFCFTLASGGWPLWTVLQSSSPSGFGWVQAMGVFSRM